MILSFSDLLPAACEIFLFFSILAMIIVGVIKLDKAIKPLQIMAIVTLISGIVITFLLPHSNSHIIQGVYIFDYFSFVCKLFILFTSCIMILLFFKTQTHETFKLFESVILLMFMAFTMLFMVSTVDFIVSFISLEILSLILYIFVAINKDDPKAIQAAVKYFIYGSIATAFLLFGISFLYGATGSTHFDNIATDLQTAVIKQRDISIALIGVFFILIAFAFKLAVAPLHFWLADIYSGCRFSTILLISTLPKFAEMMLFIRILTGALGSLQSYWQPILLVFSILCFILGTFGALSQSNLKKFFAYSTTANTGFVLLGILQGSEVGLASSGFYIFLYTLTMIGIFSLLMVIEKKGYTIETFSDLNAISPNYRKISLLLGFLTISLAGIPFSPGFFAKVYILYAAIFQEAYSITIIAILCSIISTAYYLVFIKSISFDGIASVVKSSTYEFSSFFKIATATIIFSIFSILFYLNFWIYITHKTAIALMH
jgi:NADH-quinone oxidoreductase subunit N